MTRAQAAKIAHKYAPIFAHKVSDEWIVADRIAPIDFAGEYALVAENPTKLDFPSPGRRVRPVRRCRLVDDTRLAFRTDSPNVSCWGQPPAASLTQSWGLPVIFVRKANRVPSGDREGL